MHFRNFLVFPALALSVAASVIPAGLPALARRDDALSPAAHIADLTPRGGCSTCGSGGGGGGIDVTTTLQSYTQVELDYLYAVIGVFAEVKTAVDANVTVHAVLAAGVNIVSWSRADLDALSAALLLFIDAKVKGTVHLLTAATLNIIIRAGLDVQTCTVVQARCLYTFVSTCTSISTTVAVSIKTDILRFCSGAIVGSYISITDLTVKISALLSVFVGGAVDTSVDLALQLKIKLRAYIQTCYNTAGLLNVLIILKLTLLLQIMDAWIAGNWSILSTTAAACLGITLKTSSDLTICNSIIAFLLKLSAKYDCMAALHLNLKVLATVVAH